MHNKSYNRWLVVLGAVIVQVCLGALYTWSVFQKPIQEAFNWSAPQVSLAFSINLAMIPFFMIFAGRQLERFGPTKIVIAGDEFQLDLEKGKSGLSDAIRRLNGMEGIGFFEFPPESCQRHHLVAKIDTKYKEDMAEQAKVSRSRTK